jgi:mono/diheme cytochrome c family protein
LKKSATAIVGFCAVLLILGAAGAWLLSAPKPRLSEGEAATLEQPGDVERGRLIFAAGDCASCHASPGQADPSQLGGGLALASPFGTFRVPNISSDPVDGIGSWRTIDLANALLSGVSPEGQHYYPAFPYTSYARMAVEDIRDLAAYLRTVPAVHGKPPPHEISFFLTVRRFLGLWKLAFFDQRPFAPQEARGPVWNRGAYLVQAVSHCDECHSSRNMFGAIKKDKRFAGGVDPEGAGFAPNITSARLGDWSDHDLVEMLSTGRTPRGDHIGSTMAAVVDNTSTLPAGDREAIATYIKSLPPRPTPKP